MLVVCTCMPLEDLGIALMFTWLGGDEGSEPGRVRCICVLLRVVVVDFKEQRLELGVPAKLDCHVVWKRHSVCPCRHTMHVILQLQRVNFLGSIDSVVAAVSIVQSFQTSVSNSHLTGEPST